MGQLGVGVDGRVEIGVAQAWSAAAAIAEALAHALDALSRTADVEAEFELGADEAAFKISLVRPHLRFSRSNSSPWPARRWSEPDASRTSVSLGRASLLGGRFDGLPLRWTFVLVLEHHPDGPLPEVPARYSGRRFRFSSDTARSSQRRAVTLPEAVQSRLSVTRRTNHRCESCPPRLVLPLSLSGRERGAHHGPVAQPVRAR
jgi:hypothetical protein